MTTPDLSGVAARWSPEPVSTPGSTTAWSVAAFSGLLDLDPVAGPGEVLPPLWHWFGFLDHARHVELGDDGHLADGHFMPPIPYRRRMAAGGRLRVHEPMLVDEVLLRRSRLTRCEAKSGRTGEMLLVTVTHEFLRDGRVIVVEEQDVVYRSQPPGRDRGIAAPAPDSAAPAPPGALVLTPDEAMLFRFSALTYNSHRIHYDQPYVTAVEGYPGLVVHGPLLTLLLLEMPRRQRRSVEQFEFRLTRPVFVGHPVAVTATASDDQQATFELEAGVPGLGTSVSGTATLRAP